MEQIVNIAILKRFVLANIRKSAAEAIGKIVSFREIFRKERDLAVSALIKA